MATVKELKAQAKSRGIKGFSTMRKAELEKALGTPPPKPPRLKSKAEQAKNPVKQVQPPKKVEEAPKKPAKKLSKAVMIKELKARGVPGGNLSLLDKEYLEERLHTKINPKLVAEFDKVDLDKFIDFVRDKGVEMGLPPKKKKAITEANLALFSRRMYGIDNAYERGKIDDFLKQKTVQLARNVEKEFKTKF